MTQKSKRILPPESWFLPAEDRNSRRRAQRRLEQKGNLEGRRGAQLMGLNLSVAAAADD